MLWFFDEDESEDPPRIIGPIDGENLGTDESLKQKREKSSDEIS
jgi:hypothetical protein